MPAALRYATLDSPLGPIVAALSDRGVIRLAFEDEPGGRLPEELPLVSGGHAVEDRRALDQLARELDAYFEGRRRVFRARTDLSLIPPGFARRVLEATARIPYGTVASYGRVAALAGSPRAARAAGNALHRNPVSILVPCHRVLPADGTLGGYGGDEWRKEALLALEGGDATPGAAGSVRPGPRARLRGSLLP